MSALAVLGANVAMMLFGGSIALAVQRRASRVRTVLIAGLATVFWLAANGLAIPLT